MAAYQSGGDDETGGKVLPVAIIATHEVAQIRATSSSPTNPIGPWTVLGSRGEARMIERKHARRGGYRFAVDDAGDGKAGAEPQ